MKKFSNPRPLLVHNPKTGMYDKTFSRVTVGMVQLQLNDGKLEAFEIMSYGHYLTDFCAIVLKDTGNPFCERDCKFFEDDILACYWDGLTPLQCWEYMCATWEPSYNDKERFCPMEY